MATTYSSRFYRSNGDVIPGFPFGAKGYQSGIEFNETIATTVTDGLDEHYLFPLPALGTRRLHGFWLSAGDMDTGGPTLDADIVWRYTIGGVQQTDVVLYDSSASGLFSAALANKWVGLWRLMEASDTGVGHVIFKVGVAATTPAAANLTVLPRWH